MLAELGDGVGGAVAIHEVVVAAVHGFERGNGGDAGALALLRNHGALGFRCCGKLLHGFLRGRTVARLFAVPGGHGP